MNTSPVIFKGHPLICRIVVATCCSREDMSIGLDERARCGHERCTAQESTLFSLGFDEFALNSCSELYGEMQIEAESSWLATCIVICEGSGNHLSLARTTTPNAIHSTERIPLSWRSGK